MENIFDMAKRIKDNTRYQILASDYISLIAPIDYSDSAHINTEIFSPFSYVNFTECENILRAYYKINSPEKITFFQIEINNTIDDILVNKIEYQAFNEKREQLNLSLCNQTNIELHYSLKNNTEDKINMISLFRDKGIDILDINDPFFNDLCVPYYEGDKDLTLNNRIQEYFRNYTFCEKNCELNEILFKEKMVTCNCTMKYNIDVKNLNFDIPDYSDVEKNVNFKIAKCYNAFTSLKNDVNNLGFWIFGFLMILNIIFLIMFWQNLKPFQQYITGEMAKNGYIQKNDEDKAFCHNYVKKLDVMIKRLQGMRNSFLEKKAPPKHKTHVFTKKSLSSINSLKGKKHKTTIRKKNKEDYQRDIDALKKRMEKTIRNKRTSQGKTDISIYNSKGEMLPSYSSNSKLKRNLRLSTKSNIINNKKEDNSFKINLININLNGLKKKVYVPQESKQVLNIYTFEEALKYEKRTFLDILYIFLIAKQVVMHAIFYRSPIEPLPIRLSLLKFILGCDLALNAFFYTDDKVTEKYKSPSNLILLAFTNNFTIILISFSIGYVLLTIFIHMNNTTNAIRKIFRAEEEKIKANKNYVVTLARKKQILTKIIKIVKIFKIKVIIFYVLEFLIMGSYWYYATIFCFIYKKTQISWLLDTLISVIIRFILDIFFNSIITLLYKLSIRSRCNWLYKVMNCIYCFG